MADLITLEDLEIAIGRPPANDTEEATWEFHISAVSAYINSLVDDSFELITDDVLTRVQSDYYGVLTLKGGPVEDVSSVRNWRSDEEHPSWEWNGIDQVQNLEGLQVVNVTYTHGWAQVPADVVGIATEACVIAVNNVDADDLISYQVGDVVEKYASIKTFSEAHTDDILDQYRETSTTYRLGGRGLLPDRAHTTIQNV